MYGAPVAHTQNRKFSIAPVKIYRYRKLMQKKNINWFLKINKRSVKLPANLAPRICSSRNSQWSSCKWLTGWFWFCYWLALPCKSEWHMNTVASRGGLFYSRSPPEDLFAPLCNVPLAGACMNSPNCCRTLLDSQVFVASLWRRYLRQAGWRASLCPPVGFCGWRGVAGGSRSWESSRDWHWGWRSSGASADWWDCRQSERSRLHCPDPPDEASSISLWIYSPSQDSLTLA